jgi:hypothetical protein
VTPAPQRRRFRFSLRTLFVALTVGGVWLGYHVKWIRDRHALLDEPNVTASFVPVQRAPSWALRLLGERGAHSIFLHYSWLSQTLSESDEAQRTLASRLFPEAVVNVQTGTVNFVDDPGKPPIP